jgi:hypothetical protein
MRTAAPHYDSGEAFRVGTLIVFQSSKQILSECERLLKEEYGEELEHQQVWNFRELLCWKMPEHLSANLPSKPVNKLINRADAAMNGANGGVYISNQIHLYKLDLVTQRVKE